MGKEGLAKADSCPGAAEPKPLCTVGGAQVPIAHAGKWMGTAVWVAPAMGKGKPTHGIAFPKDQGIPGG